MKWGQLVREELEEEEKTRGGKAKKEKNREESKWSG